MSINNFFKNIFFKISYISVCSKTFLRLVYYIYNRMNNTTMVPHSEFHVGGYPTIFSRIFLQTESCNIMVSYNTVDASPLCQTWKRVFALVSAF